MATFNLTQSDIERFWSKVDQSGGSDACWNWLSSVSNNYGMFGIGRRSTSAHRLSYIIANGEIPDGLKVLHDCDNTVCCNPAHLFVGTQADNIDDMFQKGRNPDKRGELNHFHVLDSDQVKTIRRRYAAGGVTQKALAQEYKVTIPTINNVINRKTWAHV